jgi:hypothetical protein
MDMRPFGTKLSLWGAGSRGIGRKLTRPGWAGCMNVFLPALLGLES